MLANIIALVSIWKIMKEEKREIKSISGVNISNSNKNENSSIKQ
jgi:hypothetical protein